jgi:ribosomal protein S18 acetylase RimI-like enzyme
LGKKYKAMDFVYVGDDAVAGRARVRKYQWRIVDYLQKDAKKKGVLKGNDFGSFWINMALVMENPHMVYVAKNTRNNVIGYFVLDEWIGRTYGKFSGDVYIEIFEVLPRFRGKGNGKKMVKWLAETAKERGFVSMSLDVANNSEKFWKSHGFVDVDNGRLRLTF